MILHRLARLALGSLLLGAGAFCLAQQAEQFFRRYDANNAGKLSREEFPERGRPLFDRIDTNKDGFVTLEEDKAFRAARAQRAQRPDQPQLPAPDHADVKYGPHERNVLDSPPYLYLVAFSGWRRVLMPPIERRTLRTGRTSCGSLARIRARSLDATATPLPRHPTWTVWRPKACDSRRHSATQVSVLPIDPV